MSRNVIARAAAATAVVIGGVLASTGVASAGQPVVHACVGTTFSDAAHALPPGGLGATISGFAQAPDARPGLGDGIQGVQAGQVPDSVAVNACND